MGVVAISAVLILCLYAFLCVFIWIFFSLASFNISIPHKMSKEVEVEEEIENTTIDIHVDHRNACYVRVSKHNGHSPIISKHS